MSGRLAIDVLLLLILAAAAVSDLRTRKVRNELTYTSVLAGLLLNGVVDPGGVGWGPAALGLLIGFVSIFVVYVAGGLGGGDVKLMAAVGAFLGTHDVVYALLYTCLVGAVMSVGIIVANEGFLGLMFRIRAAFGKSANDPKEGRLRMPFAIPVLLGCAWVITERNLGMGLYAWSQGAPR